MNGAGAIKLLFAFLAAILLINIALTGKLGSMLGAIIDPADMDDLSGGSGGSLGSQGTSGGSALPLTTGLPTSGTLTPAQIAQYARGAGFTGNNLTLSVAIALAESGGSIAAINNESNGSISRGLWQINSIHSQFDTKKLFTPAYNAAAAFQISGGMNWLPWGTYTNGRYRQFLAAAQAVTGASYITA